MKTPMLENKPSNRLFKLFGFLLLWLFIFFIYHITIRNTTLYCTTIDRALSFILWQMIFMGSGWMYLQKVDPELFQKIRKGYAPRWKTTLLATGLSILEFLFMICSMYLIRSYFYAFSMNYRSEVVAAKESLNFTYTDLSFFVFFLFSIIGTALIPAIGEELFFRGVLQSILLKKIRQVWIAIGIPALIFSFMHGVFSGIVFFPSAVLYGTLYYRTKNLFIPILMHLVCNSIIGLDEYIFQNNAHANANKFINNLFSVPSCWVGLVVSVALGYFCFKMLIKQSANTSTT